MFLKKNCGLLLAGLCAGAVNGLFGGGGGMVLIPLLGLLCGLKGKEVFPISVAIIFPICVVSLSILLFQTSFSLLPAVPYLVGSLLGGVIAWKVGRKIPTKWLHRILGIFILWGGIRYITG